MPDYIVTGPDGKEYHVTAPEGATEQQILSYAQQQVGAKQPPVQATAQNFGTVKPEPVFSAGERTKLALTKAGSLGMGYGDELWGLGRGLSYATQGKDFKTGYREGRDDIRNIEGRYEQTNPVGNFAANVTAGIPAAAAGTLNIGRLLGSRLLGGALTGGVMGGITGAASSNGDVGDRAASGGAGALVGTAIGAALPPVASAAVAPLKGAYHAITDAITKRSSALPADVTNRTGRRAARYVAGLAQTAGRTADDLAAASSPKPITAAEAIGKPGTIHLAALGRRSGQTGDRLESILTERQMGAPQRMLDDLEGAAGIKPEAARGDIDALVQRGQAEARPLYEEAYAQPIFMTPQLQTLANRPTVKRAIKAASDIIRDAGEDPGKMGLLISDDLRLSEGFRPTTQGWDYVKRYVDGELRALTQKHDANPEAVRSLTALSKELKGALREANPTYAKALDVAGDYVGSREAFKKGGQILFDGKMTEKEFATALAKMAPAEQDAFRGGIANRLYDMAQTGKLNPKVLQSPRVKAKLASAFGPEQAKKFLDGVQVEMQMANTARRMKPGNFSPTQELNAAMAEQDGATGARTMAVDFASDLGRGKGLVRSGLGALDRAAGSLIAKLPATGMPVNMRDEAGRLLMMKPEELAAYLRQVGITPRNNPLLFSAPLRGAPAAGTSAALQRRP